MEDKKTLTLPGAIIIAGTLIAVTVLIKWTPAREQSSIQIPAEQVVAAVVDGGHILPLSVEQNMLVQLQKYGVIDGTKLPQVTELNLLWAFGLANRNDILTDGPISNPQYGGPTNMASIGGWTVSEGDVMDHFDMHEFMALTPDEQALVEKVAKRTFRPCCKNSTYFPDCNHGMAMLGLLEILAEKGGTEQNLVAAATKANAIWFPQQQQTNCGIQNQSQTAPVPAGQPSCGLGA
jgi:hypothetical protein